MDETESYRRQEVARINSEVESSEEDAERKRLEEEHGQVWDTQQLTADFNVHSFMAPFISVTRKSDGAKGILAFQHMPRFYFNFEEAR